MVYRNWWEVFCIAREPGERSEWDCYVMMGSEVVQGPLYSFEEAKKWAENNYMVYVDKEFEKVIFGK